MRPLRTARPPHRVLVLACAAAIASAMPATGCASALAGTGMPVRASAVAQLSAIACRAAVVNGDPAPAWITAVKTTRAKALTSATPGDYIPGSARVTVFLITMNGHFIAADASRPPGAKAPAGRYVSLVVDAKTFQDLDFGISPGPPPVAPASLGPVTNLPRCRH